MDMTNWVIGWRVLAAADNPDERSDHFSQTDIAGRQRTKSVDHIFDVFGESTPLGEVTREVADLRLGGDLASEEIPEHALREHLLSVRSRRKDFLAFLRSNEREKRSLEK
jgi:hypothetical protein